MEMDNHMLDKEEGCYDNTEAAFSDDEEEVNNKGDHKLILMVVKLDQNKPVYIRMKPCNRASENQFNPV